MQRPGKTRLALAACALLACTPSAHAAGKSRKAGACPGGAVARAICADADLAALARETERLAKVALASKTMTKEARAVFAERTKDWRGERDACGVEARDCLIERHLARLLALRQITPDDARGTSHGPFVYACEGVAETVSAITVAGKTPRAYLAWGDYAYALAGADGRYAAELDSGAMRFATGEGGATLTLPGRGDSACRPAT